MMRFVAFLSPLVFLYLVVYRRCSTRRMYSPRVIVTLFLALFFCFGMHIIFHCSGIQNDSDISTVVGGIKSTFGLSVLLKSLLSTRRNPLFLHLMVDTASRPVVSDMMDTWMVSGLDYKLYDIETFNHLTSWVPTIHYSANYGLLKLLIPTVLKNLTSVIVLDTDLQFMDDIAPMWDKLREMQRTGIFFGMVENQSEWYKKISLKTNESRKPGDPWPALGRGFNSGLILMNLDGMRNFNWMKYWEDVARNNLKTMEYTTLADQDIFNAAFYEMPNLVIKLPCDWNFQLSYGSKEDHCLSSLTSIFRVLHFNHPDKTALLFDYPESEMDGLFTNVYTKAIETNGYLFRSMFSNCPDVKASTSKPSLKYQKILEDLSPADACYDIRLDTIAVRRIFPFFFSGRGKKEDFTSTNPVTLSTHMSFERISQLELICRRWLGGISAAIYLTDMDIISLIRLILDESSCISSDNVKLHLVFRLGSTYPVNMLRNVALKYAQTSHIFILDADFLPSGNLETLLFDNVMQNAARALVIPAFDVSSFVDLPSLGNKTEKSTLLDLVDKGLAQPFQSIKWPAGHAPTNFSRWRTSSQPYPVEWAPNYEPYIVVKKENLPSFDERFVGFGWNKVSFIMQLDARNYKFTVHPSAFVMHMPHLPSLDLMRFRSNSLYQTCLENFKLEFINELASKHGANALKYLKTIPSSKENDAPLKLHN